MLSETDRERAGRVAEALDQAFEWRDSRWGHDYWREVSTRLWAIQEGNDYGPAQETSVEQLPCAICSSTEHREECDSPGAIVVGATGCPTHDAKVRASLNR
jgi:hypothetical protein